MYITSEDQLGGQTMNRYTYKGIESRAFVWWCINVLHVLVCTYECMYVFIYAWASFVGGHVSPHPPTPHFLQWGGQIIWCPPHFLGLKKITYFNIYLRITGLIRTTFSLSTYIQIFWACTVYIGWEKTEIRATITLIFQKYSESVDLHLRWSPLVALNIFISQRHPPPPPTFSLQMTPMHICVCMYVFKTIFYINILQYSYGCVVSQPCR